MFIDFLVEVEEAEKAAELLKSAGFAGACMSKRIEVEGFECIKLALIEAKNKRELKERCERIGYDIFSVLKHRSYELSRYAVERALVDALVGVELEARGDALRYRRGGINEVLAREAAEHRVAIIFSLNHLLNPCIEISKLIGRMRQNVKICRKFGIPMLLASGAKRLCELRSAKQLFSFGLFIGMNHGEAKRALLMPELIQRIREGRKILFPGIKLR